MEGGGLNPIISPSRVHSDSSIPSHDLPVDDAAEEKPDRGQGDVEAMNTLPKRVLGFDATINILYGNYVCGQGDAEAMNNVISHYLLHFVLSSLHLAFSSHKGKSTNPSLRLPTLPYLQFVWSERNRRVMEKKIEAKRKEMMIEKKRRLKAIIIGGTIAEISCTHTPLKAGWEVKLLEKSTTQQNTVQQ